VAQSFIETQFPVSKLSKESYKERKAGNTQTLTSLGKWWGRKPLILVRATIIGLLMPASNDPKRDREIFLKILTMDEDGLYQRKSKPIALKDVYGLLSTSERKEWFEPEASEVLPKLREGITSEERQSLQKIVFNRLSYDDKLTYCDRPEQIEGPSKESWVEINTHLGTTANSLSELVKQLGEKQFGHTPSVGDAFCGGGSVPFEAARIGCEAYGSDLNPVASLLTWAALNIVGGGEEVAKQVRQAQEEVYEAVDRQIIEWGIEHNEKGWRADAYLYCNETRCPECGWMIPLAPSWVIGERTRCIGKLKPDPINRRFDILVESDVSASEMAAAKAAGTVRDSKLVCPNPHPIDDEGNQRPQETPMVLIRGRKGLRLWENRDLIPREDDVLQERLYCIRWVKTYVDAKGKERTERYYRAPDQQDFDREAKVLMLLRERFQDWQEKEYIPTRKIEPGDETTRLRRERGWTHWHHLFNPRQLLTLGLFEEKIHQIEHIAVKVASILSLSRCCDYTARLSRWNPTSSKEALVNVFSNQALNTLLNYGCRGFIAFDTSWFLNLKAIKIDSKSKTEACDARTIKSSVDIWATDPPYADAVNYHELSEFFLDWCRKLIENGVFRKAGK
jgi:putative DNA methylase